MIELAITGTDTGVGKTVVACAIASALRARAISVGVFKPVETGITSANTGDGAALRNAAGNADDLSLVRPYAFTLPVAPLAASRAEGRDIELGVLDRAIGTLRARHRALIVEGAGGLFVPVLNDTTYADLFARWKLPVLIVAADRLGVINHTILTVRAARASGLEVAAIVLNESAPADESRDTNAALISESAGAVPLLRFPRMHLSGDHPQGTEGLAAGARVLDAMAARFPELVVQR
ncbi:MAG TPA: dethiobiotin synthase [Gemmatimonadaceae bacterium]|nr:dethiobiotin synthase [Gemmatimonadaceae bacterium]